MSPHSWAFSASGSVVDGLHFVQVHAGAEGGAGAGEDDRPDAFFEVQVAEGLAELGEHRAGERVAPVGAVEHDRADGAGYFHVDGVAGHVHRAKKCSAPALPGVLMAVTFTIRQVSSTPGRAGAFQAAMVCATHLCSSDRSDCRCSLASSDEATVLRRQHGGAADVARSNATRVPRLRSPPRP